VFARALERPRPIDEVERIERAATDVFRAALAGDGSAGRDLTWAFVDFFLTLGFLFKYKPYGVKIASPFGYSVFDLYSGEGFSFQLHKEPKLEAFSILRVQPNSFVYLSTVEEWERGGEAAATTWARQRAALSSAFALTPAVGDVIRVANTEIVHSVVGCTLEEYASCSVDAVERLLDQNIRAEHRLPDEHPDVGALLQSSYPDLPRRLMERTSDGWRARALVGADRVLDVPGQLTGFRMVVDPSRQFPVPVPDEWLTVITPVSAPVTCSAAGRRWSASPGGVLAVPPGWGVQLETEQPALVAVHSIAPELVLRIWSR
jgi:hypothetical protein